jgi:hypothetical protein
MEPDIDPSLLVRVAAMSPGGQRWLKTTIQAIRSGEIPDRAEAPEERTPKPRALLKRPADLEDVITGKADLREQLDAYPELSGQLEGLGEVIDLLREAGETRRKRGEDVLRELLEGDGEGSEEEEDSADDAGKGRNPRRPRR